MTEIVVRVEVQVGAGDRDAFTAASRAAAEVVRERDTGTLAWSLFYDEELAADRGGTAVFIERFSSAAGQLEHLGNLGEVSAPMLELGQFGPMQVHGTLPAEARAQLEAHIGGYHTPVLAVSGVRDAERTP